MRRLNVGYNGRTTSVKVGISLYVRSGSKLPPRNRPCWCSMRVIVFHGRYYGSDSSCEGSCIKSMLTIGFLETCNLVVQNGEAVERPDAGIYF